MTPHGARASLGRYELRGVLGEGGFGAVHLAWDPLLEREVALKVPRGDWWGADDVLHEARALARLGHPGIVQVLDVGRHDGVLFIVLELVAGPSLEQLVEPPPAGRARRRRVLAPEDALALLRGPAEAVDHAHAAGVLHRDLKPSNLLLERPIRTVERARGVRVKVTDFGLAALAARLGPTAAGAGMGDPRYVAPEAWRGRPDRSSDVFSLAAVFFRLVAGRPPVPGDDPARWLEGAGRPERLRLSSIQPETPRPLDAALARALSARRHERPKGAVRLLDALSEAVHRGASQSELVRDALGRIAARDAVRSRRCDACRRPLSPRARECPHCGGGSLSSE